MRKFYVHWQIVDYDGVLEGFEEVKAIDAYGARRLFEHENKGVEVLSVMPE